MKALFSCLVRKAAKKYDDQSKYCCTCQYKQLIKLLQCCYRNVLLQITQPPIFVVTLILAKPFAYRI